MGLLATVLATEDLDLVSLSDTHLQHLRCQRDDPHEALVAQFAADRAEDAGPAWLLLVVDEDRGVLVEADVAAVGTALLLLRADDDALDHVALLDRSPGDGVLHRGHKDIPDRRVPAAGADDHPVAAALLGAGVVGHPGSGVLLDHRARSST